MVQLGGALDEVSEVHQLLLLVILTLLDLRTQHRSLRGAAVAGDTVQRVVPAAHIEQLRSQTVDVLPQLVGRLKPVLEKAASQGGRECLVASFTTDTTMWLKVTALTCTERGST